LELLLASNSHQNGSATFLLDHCLSMLFYSTKLFSTIFFSIFFQFFFSIFDCFLNEGNKILYRIGLGILSTCKQQLTKAQTAEEFFAVYFFTIIFTLYLSLTNYQFF